MTAKLSLVALAALAAGAAFLSACATMPPAQACPSDHGVHQRMTSTGECTHDAADFLHGG